MPADINREKRIPNTVHADAIWRQTINYELSTAKNWKNNWGFMKTLESDLPTKDHQKLPPISTNPHASGLASKLQPGLADSENSIIADCLCSHKISQIISYRLPDEKYTIPVTTSSEIGWPWKNVQIKLGIPLPPIPGDRSHTKSITGPASLERYGRVWARGRGDVMKWFGGCRESLP